MNVQEVMNELESMGNPGTKKIFLKHGAVEPFFGVKVGDLKKIQKKVKKDQELALALYDTGNSDAMYLAGLIADENAFSKAQLQDWAEKAPWNQISEYTVAWITSETPHGWELGLEWIECEDPKIAATGWATLGNWVAIRPDEELDVQKINSLLDMLSTDLHDAPNRVRYCMNNFIIAAGGAVIPCHAKAIETATKVGKVQVFMGETACKVPDAVTYIEKINKMGRLGKKKKQARC